MDSKFILCGPGNNIFLIYKAGLRHFWHQFRSTFVSPTCAMSWTESAGRAI